MGKKQPFLPDFGLFWPVETKWKLKNVQKVHKNMEDVELCQNNEKIAGCDVIIGPF